MPDLSEQDKRLRILSAAQNLFVRYGVRRTSVDDVARDAGIAKGTVYLYYDSKEALFAAVAKKICADVLGEARKAATSRASLKERLVGILDAEVGVMHRLVAHSPHVAELTETKEAVALATFEALRRDIHELIRGVLHEEGIAGGGAAEMFLAAAIGVIRTGDAAEEPYRARLVKMVDVLIGGLRQGKRGKGEPRRRAKAASNSK